MQLTGIGLFLELNRPGVGRELTGTVLCLEMKRASMVRAVNRYWIVFGFEESRSGA